MIVISIVLWSCILFMVGYIVGALMHPMKEIKFIPLEELNKIKENKK